MRKKQRPQLYVILREDLAFKYIQGQHAVAQFAMEHPESFKEWNNQYLINLSVFNGLMLDAELVKLQEQGFELSTFIEPDLGDKLTGIVLFENGDGKVAKALSHLRLSQK